MHKLLIALMVLTLAVGCNQKKNQLLFEGQYFKAKAKKEADDLSVFLVSVSPISASLEGARAAGQYEATRYCIDNYGNSKIDWIVGPKDEASTYQIDKDTVFFKGRCDP